MPFLLIKAYSKTTLIAHNKKLQQQKSFIHLFRRVLGKGLGIGTICTQLQGYILCISVTPRRPPPQPLRYFFPQRTQKEFIILWRAPLQRFTWIVEQFFYFFFTSSNFPPSTLFAIFLPPPPPTFIDFFYNIYPCLDASTEFFSLCGIN